MAKASKAKQITLILPNRVGTLAKVSDVISRAGVNVNAISARGDKRRAYFHIQVDRHVKARNALAKEDFSVADEDVVLLEMPNKPGQMQKVAEKLAAAGIDIMNIYGSAGSGRSTFCVLSTSDDRKAIKLIQGK